MSSPRLLSLGESCGDTRRHVSPLTWQPTPSGSPPPAPSTIPLELPTDLSLRSLSLCAGPSAESTPLGVLAPQISCAAPRRARPGRPSCLIACLQPAGGASGLPCAATALLTLAARHVSAQAKRSFLCPPQNGKRLGPFGSFFGQNNLRPNVLIRPAGRRAAAGVGTGSKITLASVLKDYSISLVMCPRSVLLIVCRSVPSVPY